MKRKRKGDTQSDKKADREARELRIDEERANDYYEYYGNTDQGDYPDKDECYD